MLVVYHHCNLAIYSDNRIDGINDQTNSIHDHYNDYLNQRSFNEYILTIIYNIQVMSSNNVETVVKINIHLIKFQTDVVHNTVGVNDNNCL